MVSMIPKELVEVPKEPVQRWCLGCGRSSTLEGNACSECGGRLTTDEILPPSERPGFSFSLGTLMLLMTLICVLTGLTVSMPVVGISLSFFAIPGLLFSVLKYSHGFRHHIEHPVREFFITTALLALGVAGAWLAVGGAFAAFFLIKDPKISEIYQGHAAIRSAMVLGCGVVSFAGFWLARFASKRFDA